MRHLRPFRLFLRRNLSSAPPPAPRPPASSFDKLPPYLLRYAHHFRTAPKTHITAFLVLHELTAIIPAAGFFYLFHAAKWTPVNLLPEEWVEQGVGKWGRYLEKKGWAPSAQVVLELASAWAVVKALMPVRVAVSLWATPWAAKVGMRAMAGVRAMVGGKGGKL